MSTLDKIQALLKEQKKTQKDLMDYLGLEKSTTSNIYTHLDFSSKVSSANAIVSIFPENTKV